jgi:hypothetical protein
MTEQSKIQNRPDFTECPGESEQRDQVRKLKTAIRINSRCGEAFLTDKPLHGNEALAHRINGEKKAFESDGAKQGWSIGRDKAWGRNLIPIQRQSCFSNRPDVSLSACDHDALRAGGLQLKPFRQRLWHYTESSSSIDKKLHFLNAPRRPGEMTLYVEKPHIKRLWNSTLIVAQATNNTTVQTGAKNADNPGMAANRRVNQVRTGDQSQGRQADRPCHSAECFGQSRSSNPIAVTSRR